MYVKVSDRESNGNNNGDQRESGQNNGNRYRNRGPISVDSFMRGPKGSRADHQV